MDSITKHTVLRALPAALAVMGGLALLAGCSSSGPSASSSPSPSVPKPVVASDVPLEEQLLEALRAGDVSLTSALLAEGADVDAPLAEASRAIDIALVRNDPALVAAVLDAEPDLGPPEEGAMPVLNSACFRGVSGEVVELLLDAGAATDATSDEQFGSLPIHECAYSGSIEAIGVLLDHGVDVNSRQTVYEATPLIVAAWQGDEDTVMFLLDNGADPTLTTQDGATARKWALVAGDQELAEFLAQLGG
jgi:hypothetical protein